MELRPNRHEEYRLKAWMFTLWTALDVFTMREIEGFVADGTLRPFMGACEARLALEAKGWKFHDPVSAP